MTRNIDSFEQPKTRIGRLRMRRCPTPALTIFVVYAFYVDLEKFHGEDDAFYAVIISDFNAKIGPQKNA
ncbi:hypothetical protein RB195_026323 [Necator americanus]|uniref:Uncharacterized protein n=1 Tax=Necator americanus TaxID=51031 RepID=A0ABR1EWE8_NECAM